MNKEEKKKIAKTVKKKELFKTKNGNKCVYCGCTNTLALNIDHIIPLVRKGKDTDANKQVTCIICNKLKGPLTDKEFREYMKALEILKKLYKINLKLNLHLKFNSEYFPVSNNILEEK